MLGQEGELDWDDPPEAGRAREVGWSDWAEAWLMQVGEAGQAEWVGEVGRSRQPEQADRAGRTGEAGWDSQEGEVGWVKSAGEACWTLLNDCWQAKQKQEERGLERWTEEQSDDPSIDWNGMKKCVQQQSEEQEKKN